MNIISIATTTDREQKLGREVQRLVRAKDYKEVIRVLNKVKVPKGYTLSIRPYKKEEECGLGTESHVIITTPDKQIIRDDQKEFWKLLSVERSPMGAWQVYLLFNMWHYLPLFWHALYEKRSYVYSNTQLKRDSRYWPEYEAPETKIDLGNCDVQTTIMSIGDSDYYIGACYWSDFEGLVYEKRHISLYPSVHVYARPESHRALFRYKCGICF